MANQCTTCKAMKAELLEVSARLQAISAIIGGPSPLQAFEHARKVVAMVSRVYGVSQSALSGRNKSALVAWPRQVAMYLLREHTALSLQDIGNEFHRHHGTVIHAMRAVRSRIDTDKKERKRIMELAAVFQKA